MRNTKPGYDQTMYKTNFHNNWLVLKPKEDSKGADLGELQEMVLRA